SAACVVGEKQPFNLTTASPNNIYKVQLKEQVEIYHVPFTGHGLHEVKLGVFKEGKSIVEDETLYSGGVYDGRFLDLFPEHVWIDDSVLRFGEKDLLPQSQHDEVSISNQ